MLSVVINILIYAVIISFVLVCCCFVFGSFLYSIGYVVTRYCYDCILWENDIMRKQLAEIGKSFGEKMDDVQKVVHARWIQQPHKNARICSSCERVEPYKFVEDDVDVYNYCPHCGAKMDL